MLRKIAIFFNQATDKKAEVFHDSETHEFPVKFYSRGQYKGEDCDYPAETRKEADNTAQWWIHHATN
jgi:hypothetical protein